MEIFISYSHKDKNRVKDIINALVTSGHKVWYDTLNIQPGDNFITKINEGIMNADVLLIILSNNSVNSGWVRKEYSAMALKDISEEHKRIIPVLIDDVSVPSYLSNYIYLDLSVQFNINLNRLIQQLDEFGKETNKNYVKKLYEYDNAIKELSKALKNGNLTLVCGAGVSIGAGVPSWNNLLLKLLESMMNEISINNGIKLNNISVSDFNNRYSYSSLIVGKYLKTNIGDSFNKEIRKALYSSAISDSQIIDAIIDLARPERDRKPLDSIITFNFDTLIEENLAKSNIKYKSIYDEGMKFESNAIPIYHVHGYLPRNNSIPTNANLIFSEDAYHSQFIEPFSWSNLIQLNKFNQSTCLFTGLSLSDPNLRRLLDVSNRKSTDKVLSHYIIKKSPLNKDQEDKIDELAFFLEEQDANELGLNVIWVDNYDDIPNILKSISAY